MYGSVPVNNVIFSLRKNLRFTLKPFAYANLSCKQLERVKTGIHFNIPKNKKVYSNKTINLIHECNLDYVLKSMHSCKLTFSIREF